MRRTHRSVFESYRSPLIYYTLAALPQRRSIVWVVQILPSKTRINSIFFALAARTFNILIYLDKKFILLIILVVELYFYNSRRSIMCSHPRGTKVDSRRAIRGNNKSSFIPMRKSLAGVSNHSISARLPGPSLQQSFCRTFPRIRCLLFLRLYAATALVALIYTFSPHFPIRFPIPVFSVVFTHLVQYEQKQIFILSVE